MKKILVTVEEFVNNGGKMLTEDGTGRRKIFYENGIQISIQDAELYNSIIKYHSNGYYVQIDCQPIYV